MSKTILLLFFNTRYVPVDSIWIISLLSNSGHIHVQRLFLSRIYVVLYLVIMCFYYYVSVVFMINYFSLTFNNYVL